MNDLQYIVIGLKEVNLRKKYLKTFCKTDSKTHKHRSLSSEFMLKSGLHRKAYGLQRKIRWLGCKELSVYKELID